MSRIRNQKESFRQKQRNEGMFAPDSYANVMAVTPCSDGKSGGTYSCSNVDMYGFLSHQAMGSTTREGNDVWGWTSPDGRELAAVGQTDGTAFVEILSDGSLKYLGRLPTATSSSIWRDMKVIDGYVYIGSEASSHGLQVFDMRKLLTLTSPRTFSTTSDVTARFTGFGNSHNIVANEATKTIYAVGSNQCRGGLYMLDVSNPARPTSLGCASSDGYVHDAQCVIYTGPHKVYQGKEICFGYNEDTLTIYDVSSKSSVEIISRTGYSGASYTHQGWLANSAMTHLLLDDELDEQDHALAKTTTYIWDITNLASPKLTGTYKSTAKAIDHNLYVVDTKAYMSNYGSGLRIVDISTLSSTPSGSSFREVGYFDVYPEDDSNPRNEFYGAWSVYPYFKSGYIIVNSIERGVFSLKYTGN
ncbi:hypothetical protein BDZ91DRAFT_654077 [Kalaharituber pfeilii]|nr:hypothetical protein BDZ91DRAFT_654077 [Kalaharituber pfeilii]